MLFDQLSQRLSAHQRSLSACTHIGRKAFEAHRLTPVFRNKCRCLIWDSGFFVFWRRTQAVQGSGLEIRQAVQAVREFESHREYLYASVAEWYMRRAKNPGRTKIQCEFESHQRYSCRSDGTGIRICFKHRVLRVRFPPPVLYARMPELGKRA